MSDFWEEIEQEAGRRFNVSGTIEELQASATLAKTIAEGVKAKNEARNYQRQLHLERVKSWSTLLVPIVSLLALLVTIIIQTVQIRQQMVSAQRQSEDAEWRELLASLHGPATNYASDITVPSRMQKFLKSDRYNGQARYLAARIMGNFANRNGFIELFTASIAGSSPEEFKRISHDDFKRILDIARSLSAMKVSLESECQAESLRPRLPSVLDWGMCSLSLRDTEVLELAKSSKDPAAAMARRRSYLEVIAEIAFVSDPISRFLRERYAVGSALSTRPNVDMTLLALVNADLSKVDFSTLDLSSTMISYAKLEDAIVAPRAGYPDFSNSEWWKAKTIEKQLLTLLIENRYPHYLPGLPYPTGEPTRKDYDAHIKRLCAGQGIVCEDPPKFGPLSPQPGPPLPGPR